MTDAMHRDDGQLSTAAIVSYLLIAQFMLIALGVFTLLWMGLKIDPAMLTVLGALVTCAVGGISVVGGFWLAGAIGSKADRAALRQLAGAGAPPPADPGSGVPAETVAEPDK